MTRSKTAILLTLALVLIATAAFADSIEGTYDCKGKGAGGGEYKGTVAVMKNGDAYNITWTLGSGETYTGVGLLSGDTFSVGYASGDKSWYGVVVYTVKGKTLEGRWAMGGSGAVSTETLTKK